MQLPVYLLPLLLDLSDKHAFLHKLVCSLYLVNRRRNHIRVQLTKNWSEHVNCAAYSTQLCKDRQKVGTCIVFVGLGQEQKCTSWERSMMDGVCFYLSLKQYISQKIEF